MNLEIITDQTSESFILALRKHSAVYGQPSRVLADNAAYFHHASDLLTNRLQENNIQFQFQPAGAPWYGAVFERLIGVLKPLIRRTIGRKLLPLTEMETFVKEVAAVVNDRPLTVSSSDIKDDLPLTPNKLIFGRNITPIAHSTDFEEDPADPSWQPDNETLSAHWKSQAKRFHHFREQFNREYLSLLRQRHAYDSTLDPNEPANIAVGDLVIIYDEGHRLMWKRGEVLELIHGSDGQVRAVRLATAHGETSRPISRLYPLRNAHELRGDQDQNGQDQNPPPTPAPPAPQATPTAPATTQAQPNPQATPTAPAMIQARPRRDAAVAARDRIRQCMD
jgi:hypothetical protein